MQAGLLYLKMFYNSPFLDGDKNVQMAKCEQADVVV